MLRHSYVYGNTAGNHGGGGYADGNIALWLENVRIEDNEAAYGGGGLGLWNADLTMRRCDVLRNRVPELEDNAAEGNGGASTLSRLEAGSREERSRATCVGPMEEEVTSRRPQWHSQTSCSRGTRRLIRKGGGLALVGSTGMIHLLRVALRANESYVGGGIYISDAKASLVRCNFFVAGGPSHNLDSLDETNMAVAPDFVDYPTVGEEEPSDLHLYPTSPLVDAGDPDRCSPNDTSGCDSDGSLPDIGAYGGPDADRTGYDDQDGDGMYRSWERTHGLDTEKNDAGEDPDGDGATNGDEFRGGSNPSVPDSDDDGYLDGDELFS